MRCFAVLLLLFLQCYLQEASRFNQQVRNGYPQESRTLLNVVVLPIPLFIQFNNMWIINLQNQCFDVPTAGAQALPVDGIGRLGRNPPRRPSAD
ncbi:hypothetical protein evm_001469 [Chilo suppressalis]|nr:hypothetical protein evm_001469 [Chilo suppressalis]